MTAHHSSNHRADRGQSNAWLYLRALLFGMIGLVLIVQLGACTARGRRGYARSRYVDKPSTYGAEERGYDPYSDPYRYDDPYRDPYGRDPYGRGPYDQDRVYVNPR